MRKNFGPLIVWAEEVGEGIVVSGELVGVTLFREFEPPMPLERALEQGREYGLEEIRRLYDEVAAEPS